MASLLAKIEETRQCARLYLVGGERIRLFLFFLGGGDAGDQRLYCVAADGDAMNEVSTLRTKTQKHKNTVFASLTRTRVRVCVRTHAL